MPAEKKASKGASASALRTVAFVVAVLALIALVVFFWAARHTEAGAPSAPDSEAKGNLHLETFVLNLAEPAQRSYLRVGIDLGLGREIERGEDPPIARVRDTILGVLEQARVEDLTTAEGKVKLKADLLRALQQRVPDLKVEEVYFTEFLIQR